MKLGTWNFRSLQTAGYFTAAVRELASYKLDVVSVKEVKWDKGSTVTVNRNGSFVNTE